MKISSLSDNSADNIQKHSLLLLLIAFIIQGGSIYYLFNNSLNYALLLHLLSASLFPFALQQILPGKFRKDPAIFSFLFLMCCLVPFVSGIGLLLSLSIGIYSAKPIVKQLTNTVHSEPLPEDLLESVQLSQYNESSVIGILESSTIEEQRIKAVLKTRQMTDQEAIPILRVALLDPVDEVRLLAYSMLDKKEKNIDHLIHQEAKKIAENPTEKLILVHLSLAESYWELSYLGLVSGQAKQHILQDAYEHIQRVLKSDQTSAESYFLQARIALSLNLYDVAEQSLSMALKLGINAVRVAPYQAELAFVTRKFDEIEQYINIVDDTAKNNDLISGMVKQWG
ncbi:MAG: hypothetical protein QM500_10505 [Methylococcales bacterium]